VCPAPEKTPRRHRPAALREVGSCGPPRPGILVGRLGPPLGRVPGPQPASGQRAGAWPKNGGWGKTALALGRALVSNFSPRETVIYEAVPGGFGVFLLSGGGGCWSQAGSAAPLERGPRCGAGRPARVQFSVDPTGNAEGHPSAQGSPDPPRTLAPLRPCARRLERLPRQSRRGTRPRRFWARGRAGPSDEAGHGPPAARPTKTKKPQHPPARGMVAKPASRLLPVWARGACSALGKQGAPRKGRGTAPPTKKGL